MEERAKTDTVSNSELNEPLGLKPCPFCGEIPPIDDPYTFYANQGEKWGHVLCGCGAVLVAPKYERTTRPCHTGRNQS